MGLGTNSSNNIISMKDRLVNKEFHNHPNEGAISIKKKASLGSKINSTSSGILKSNDQLNFQFDQNEDVDKVEVLPNGEEKRNEVNDNVI